MAELQPVSPGLEGILPDLEETPNLENKASVGQKVVLYSVVGLAGAVVFGMFFPVSAVALAGYCGYKGGKWVYDQVHGYTPERAKTQEARIKI